MNQDIFKTMIRKELKDKITSLGHDPESIPAHLIEAAVNCIITDFLQRQKIVCALDKENL